jgi:putative DNA primase/helicase
MCGYALTGTTREHALFFLYGTGANGKSVFLSTLCGMMGDYAKTAPIATFIDSKNQNHPTDLAGLRGARIVTAVETENGRRWAESKLKALTGGDRITARFMRQDFFEYIPQFKLIIAGNHKPGLQTVDESMRRRFNFLPFTVTIPPSERDAELTEKLRSEWPGILAWAIEGCLAWQREGLNQPRTVIEATAEYLESEDSIAQWISERCGTGVDFRETTAILFADFVSWTKTCDIPAGSQRGFSDTLLAKGYQPWRNKIARGFQGIGLRAR